jgi:type IV pilus assembly protein PilA
MRREGFTLVELLVVVLILAILMAVALPLYLRATAHSERRACRANMRTLANAEQAYYLSHSPRRYVKISGGPPGSYQFSDVTGRPVTDFLGANLMTMPLCPTGHAYGANVDNAGLEILCTNGPHGRYVPGRDAE